MNSRLYCWAMLTLLFAVSGCSEATNAPLGISAEATPAVFNAAGSPTVDFSLPDMMCEDGCALAVKDILMRQRGAQEVLVDFEGKTATVAIDEDAFDSEKAIAALVDKGFDHSALKGETESIRTTDQRERE